MTMVLSIFWCIFCYLYIFFGGLFKSFAHIFIGLIVFLLLNFESSLYILGKSFIRYMLYKDFLPVYGFFHFHSDFEDKRFLILMKSS